MIFTKLNNLLLIRIKYIIDSFRIQIKQTKELDWANVFHDTIKGRSYLQNLEISPGRWAANYSLLYIITRILSDHKPLNIIEFGLGESTKLISTFLENELPNSKLTTIEHNLDWTKVFKSRFSLSKNVNLSIHEIGKKSFKGYITNFYKNLQEYHDQKFDLYIVDGISSKNYSRNDIIDFINKATDHEFIIIIDDANRIGEQETFHEIIYLLKEKKKIFYTAYYEGLKSQKIIATEKYKFVTSL